MISFESSKNFATEPEVINPDESTQEAIGDWHYWVAQGYCF